MDKAEMCWEAARLLDVGPMTSALDALSLVDDSAGHGMEVALDLVDHVAGLPRIPPEQGTRAGRAARIRILSLAAEYYEAEAEGRVHP